MEEKSILYIIWRTHNRQFHIEGLFDSLDGAREWIRVTMDARRFTPRGNWIVSFDQPERWTLQSSGGVWHVAPAEMNSAMITIDDEAE